LVKLETLETSSMRSAFVIVYSRRNFRVARTQTQ
jgi:hypothetical protein